MITGLVVLKIVLMPSRHFLASLANSGPRWSMIGVSIARNTRSGSGVGPGICRKWRPTLRAEFWAMGRKAPAVWWISCPDKHRDGAVRQAPNPYRGIGLREGKFAKACSPEGPTFAFGGQADMGSGPAD